MLCVGDGNGVAGFLVLYFIALVMPQQDLSPYLTSQAWIINQFLFRLMSVGILGLWNFFVCLTAGYWWNETKMEIAQRQLHSKSTFLVTVEIC